MISCNSALEQGNLDLWRYINAFIIILKLCKMLLDGCRRLANRGGGGGQLE